MQNKIAICLMGPTASGKTSLAIDLANRGGFELISVDSAQVYKQMNIGNAKPTKDELALAPHRLLDFIDPADIYSVGQFFADAKDEMADIFANNHTPVLVGGTMMYFNALQNGLSELPPSNVNIRSELSDDLHKFGSGKLHKRLDTIDPMLANKIHPNDTQRILRALEVFALTGESILKLNRQNKMNTDVHFINTAIIPDDRSKLHEQIKKRFNDMLEMGLEKEVRSLFNRGDLHRDLPSMRSVGYRQVWAYLEGKTDYRTMCEQGVIATRQLAKRQITWLRRWQDLTLVQSADEIITLFEKKQADKRIH